MQRPARWIAPLVVTLLVVGCKPADRPAGAASPTEAVEALLQEGNGVEARQRILREGLQNSEQGRLLLLRADMMSGLYQDALRATLELEDALPEGFADDVCVAAVASSLDDEDLDRARQNVGQCARLGDPQRIDRRAARWRLHVVSGVEGALEQYGALLDDLPGVQDPVIADFVASTVHDTVIANYETLGEEARGRAFRRLVEMTSSYDAQLALAGWYLDAIEGLAAQGQTVAARRCLSEIWSDDLTDLVGRAPDLEVASTQGEATGEGADPEAGVATAPDEGQPANAPNATGGEDRDECPLRPWPTLPSP